jgi:hypothetical protein
MKRLNASTIDELRALPPQLVQWDNASLVSDNFAAYVGETDGLIDPSMRWRRRSGLTAGTLLHRYT